MFENILKGNREFVEEDFRKNTAFYQTLAKGQNPQILWIGCSDSRVVPERITASKPGDLFVHRNIGNIVPCNDWNFVTMVEYAIKHLKVRHIVICGHSDCGAMKALDKEGDDAYIPLWLNNAREAKERVDRKMGVVTSQEAMKQRKKMIELENIRLQTEHLKKYPIVARALEKGDISVHGVYYDLESGQISVVT
ncbi:MAG: carbonic anhydrase [Methanomicrobiales archaeon]|nr:carbonic anhydrase [Methanomicrobiales archaeon]